MRAHVQRRDFLKLGAAGLAAAGTGSLLTAPGARAVPPKPAEDDFGYVQFGVTAELVCAAFYRRALAAGDWTRGERPRLALAHEGDTRHLRTLNAVLAELAGGTATTSGLQGATFLEPGGRELDTYLSFESFPNEGGA